MTTRKIPGLYDDDGSPMCVMMPAGSNTEKLYCCVCDEIAGTSEDWLKGVGEYDGTAQCVLCLVKTTEKFLIEEHGGLN
jgi:hypothetical protein